MAEPRPRTRAGNSAAGSAQPRPRARATGTGATAAPRQRARAPRPQPVEPQPHPQAPQAGASNERSLGDLFSDLTDKLRTLVQRELELVKIEMKDEINKGVKGVGMFAGAGVTAFVAVLMLAMAAAWGLAEVVEPGLAFLIVAVVFGLIAAILGLQGKSKLQQLNPVPQQTMATIKEDVQVAKDSLSDGVSTEQPNPQATEQAQPWTTAGAGADQYARRS